MFVLHVLNEKLGSGHMFFLIHGQQSAVPSLFALLLLKLCEVQVALEGFCC